MQNHKFKLQGLRQTLIMLSVLATILIQSCSDGESYALIETDFGDMKVLLYNDTPIHKENFIKLAEEGFYDSLMFHRVIKEFMVQGGDPNSKNAAPGQSLGAGGLNYTLEAELGLPHLKGALAAARTGGAGNPDKRSSSCQFYLVHGKTWTDQELDQFEKQGEIKYSAAQRDAYKTIGGVPFLDMEYTVYGEVVEGLDVIDKIANVQTAPGDRPLEDVRMKIKML